jgi:hypothetical protein
MSKLFNIFKIVLIVLLVLFIVTAILYYIYHYKRLFIINTPLYMGSYEDLKDASADDDMNTTIDYEDTPLDTTEKVYTNDKLSLQQNAYNYSYTFFIKIDSLDYKYNQNKEIFSKGGSIDSYTKEKDTESAEDNTKDNKQKKSTETKEILKGAHNPRIYIAKRTNDLIVEITTYVKRERCIIENIPLQSWVFVGVVVHNKTIDIYINGTLFKSHVLENLPVQTEATIRYGLNGGFDGSLNKLVYYFRALSSLEIMDLFHKNKGGLTNSVDAKEKSKEIKKIKQTKKEIESCYS